MSDYNLEQPSALPYVPTETVYLCPAQSELAPARGSEAWPTQHSGNRFEYRSLNGEWQVYGDGLRHVCMCNCESTADMITRCLNKQMPQNDPSSAKPPGGEVERKGDNQ